MAPGQSQAAGPAGSEPGRCVLCCFHAPVLHVAEGQGPACQAVTSEGTRPQVGNQELGPGGPRVSRAPRGTRGLAGAASEAPPAPTDALPATWAARNGISGSSSSTI